MPNETADSTRSSTTRVARNAMILTAISTLTIVLAIAPALIPLKMTEDAEPSPDLELLNTSQLVKAAVGQTQVEATYKIRNNMKRELKFTDWNVSCGCLRADADPKTIPPGSQGIIRLRAMPPTAGRTTLHASARTNAPSTEVVSLKLIVEGAGAPPYIAVAPDAVSLGSLNDPDELQEVIVIETRELPESQPWISNASCDTASLSVRLDTVHEENLDGLVLRKYALTVSARDDWSGGTIEGSILLSSGSTGSNEIKRIRIFGDVQDGLRWSPRIISIPRDRGEKTTESVRIVLRHPHRCSSWSLSVSDSSKAHFKILGVSNAKNMSIIEVLAIKSALSEGKCSLVLETGCEEYPRIEIPVELQQ